MAHYNSFEDLGIYLLSREICQEVWKLINETSLAKDYKLRDQINGSSGSVMDNIAEDFGRGGNKEFINFLSIAKGSCCETKAQLSKFMNYLKSSERKGSKYD